MLIHGAAGGVGHFATQLAHWRGAHVIGTTSPAAAEQARLFGADEVVDPSGFEQDVAGVDLVFDTAGGTLLERSPAALGEGGRIVSIAEEPPASLTNAAYFVVEPNRDQLVEIASLIDGGQLRPAIDSVFGISDVRAAFERSLARGKRGKVVIRIVG